MKDRPNIIWVFADQLRRQALGSAGDPNVRTPVLDRLAVEGTRFDAACSTYAVCVPFRFTLLTGERASSRWVPTIHWRMSPCERTIAHHLNENGYRTVYVGKWHQYGGSFGADTYRHIPVPREHQGGFERWKAFELRNNHFDTWYFCEDDPVAVYGEGYQTDVLFDVASREIRELAAAGDRAPFFLALSVSPPHPPYIGPNYHQPDRAPRDITLRPNVDVEKLRTNKPWLFADRIWGMERRFPSEDPTERLKCHLIEYYEMIEHIDSRMGHLMDTLRELGVEDETVVMFFSDHGELLGSHGEQAKQWPYEESIGIPLMVWGAGSGGVISEPVCTEDLFPTTLGLAGVPVPEGKPGLNLAPYLDGRTPLPRDEVYLEFVEELRDTHKNVPHWRGLRTTRYKYVATAEGPYMLYDLAEDPYEMKNLVQSPAHEAIRNDLRARLMEHLRRTGDSFYHAFYSHRALELPGRTGKSGHEP